MYIVLMPLYPTVIFWLMYLKVLGVTFQDQPIPLNLSRAYIYTAIPVFDGI